MDNPNHDLRPGMYATVKLEVPAVQLQRFSGALATDWSEETVADSVARLSSGSALPFATAGPAPLIRAAAAHAIAAQGLVLALPESAVIDTGSRKIVYREAAPGVYEGVEVRLGSRCGTFYPVSAGLEPGQKVATAGSFLIDAETRLTGGLGSTYFGASGGPQSDKQTGSIRPSASTDKDAAIRAKLAKLSPQDQKLAEAQQFCAVQTKNRLGTMGVPVKIVLRGRPVFLCCEGCEENARADVDATLATVEKLKAKSR
jgi:hypothetical protein